MATTERIVDVLSRLAEPRAKDWAFPLVKELSELVALTDLSNGDDQRLHEAVLRALELRTIFGPWAVVIDDIARARGLFPYLDPTALNLRDRFAYEAHRPIDVDDVVFHSVQAEVYRRLLDGENVILSAPTSFGKSLIVDAMIATARYRNIAVIVPTIALIDETRRRLTDRFGDRYKVITHVGQQVEGRNIFVLTQERVLQYEEMGEIDFVVVDEFYKLDPRRDAERSILLNQAFYRLLGAKTQFYLLGPSIRGVPEERPPRFRFTFIKTDYSTVVSEVARISVPKSERQDRLIDLVRTLKEPTLIYCASPASARRVVTALDAARVREPRPDMAAAADWIAEHYHPDWALVRALRRGIGLHHGQVPRALQQYLVRAFNGGQADVLVCTSTLIEGVNTKAKNVVVYDNKVATRKVDFFTFNNIRGRSGRMFQHFIGRVFLFYDPPPDDLPILDVPLLTQTDSAPDSLLIQMQDGDLTDESRDRIAKYQNSPLLTLEVLRENRGVDPAAQLRLAGTISSSLDRYAEVLVWKGVPEWAELLGVCELIWDHLVDADGRVGGISSAKQLAFKVTQFRKHRTVKSLILHRLSEQGTEPDADEAVEETLQFLRYWAAFSFPRFLMTLDRIQRHLFGQAKRPAGDYSYFATTIENQFLPTGVSALDEYGLPTQIGVRLGPSVTGALTIDEALRAFKSLDLARLPLSEFERDLAADAQTHS